MSNRAQAKLADEVRRKQTVFPEKYILSIKTPKQALIVEGRRDFAEYNNRDASTVAWFELLHKLSKLIPLNIQNTKYGLLHYSPLLKLPEGSSGMSIEHAQDGTVAFRGRIFSNCANNSEHTTLELFDYFKEIIAVNDDEVRAVLQEFCVGLYDL